MQGIKDFFSEEEGSVDFKWHRRAEELAFLQQQMTFEMVTEMYDEMLLNKETKRLAIFRTFPESQYDLATKLDFENNAQIVDDKERKDNIAIDKSHFIMFNARWMNTDSLQYFRFYKINLINNHQLIYYKYYF